MVTNDKESRRNFLRAIGVASGSAFIAGCSSGGGSTTTEQPETTAGGGGETTTSGSESTTETAEESVSVTAGLSANQIETLDPAMIDVEEGIHVASNIFNGLITYNKDLNVQPDLATDWTWNSDTEVTFNLRDGVKFHNGEDLTAADVKATYERVLDKDTGSPWRSKLTSISEITADGLTVTFSLEKPFSPLESYMVRRNMGGCILPKSLIESDTNIAQNPIGTGPFSLGEWDQGSQMTLQKFDDFWREDRPYVDEVSLQMIPDTTTLTTALEAGDVDMINAVPQQAMSRLQSKGNVNVYTSSGVNVRYIGFNTRDASVFSNKKVRQAASLAMSRENMVQVLGPKIFSVNRTPVPKALSWAYTDDVSFQTQDKARAEQLLSEAGAEGASIGIKVWKGQSWRKIASTARDMLNAVGFDAEVKVFEFGTFWDQVTKANEFDAFVLGWTGLTDPDGYLYSQFHSGGVWNWMGYENSEVDSMLEEARAATSQSERGDIYKQIQKQVCEDAVYASLTTQSISQAARDYISGYELLPTSSFRFENVQKNK